MRAAPGPRPSFVPGSGLPRLVELPVALAAFLAASPVLLLAALAVAVSSSGPILFRQRRMGRGARPFTFLKLRTMRAAAGGLALTASGDARVTRVGRVLRKLKLDELPGLWNVLKGDLALVGPRPEVPEFVDEGEPRWRDVLSCRPGLTDPVTLRLRNEEELLAAVEGDPRQFYSSYLLPFKLEGYRNYLAKRSWKSDLEVLWDTLLAVLFPGRNPPPTTAEILFLWGGEEAQHVPESSRPTSWRYRYQRQIQLGLDLAVLIGAFLTAYFLRFFDFEGVPAAELEVLRYQLPLVVLVQLVAMFLAGIPNFVWRYVSLSEVPAFLYAALGSAVPMLVLRYSLPAGLHVWRVPASVVVMDTILAFGGLLGLRVLRRMQHERELRGERAEEEARRARPVLLIGAGQAGILAARELIGRGIEIKGFIDEDPLKLGTVIRGLRVLGNLQDLGRLVSVHDIDHVIVTIASASPLELGRILEVCRKVPIRARIMPGIYDLLAGREDLEQGGGAGGRSGSGAEAARAMARTADL